MSRVALVTGAARGLGRAIAIALAEAGADVALGLLNRVAPALNAFALGFPAKILLTLILAGTAVLMLPQTVRGLVTHAVHAMLTAAGG